MNLVHQITLTLNATKRRRTAHAEPFRPTTDSPPIPLSPVVPLPASPEPLPPRSWPVALPRTPRRTSTLSRSGEASLPRAARRPSSTTSWRSTREQKVTYTRFVNDDRGNLKVNTALQGGVDIDVFFTYDSSNLAMRSYSGMAADLGALVRDTPDLAPFLDTDEPKALIDGETIMALATTKEPNFLLMNETVREDVGLALPTAWELRGVSRGDPPSSPPRIGTGHTNCRICLASSWVPNYWYTDQGTSNFEHPAFLRHFELTTQMIREGQIFPWSQVLARQIEAYQQNNFIAEDFAIWGTAPFSLRFLNDPEEYPHDFLTSCAPMPTVDGADWNSGFFGNYIQINAKSPKQELAEEFVKFWLLEGAADMAPGGKIPHLGQRRSRDPADGDPRGGHGHVLRRGFLPQHAVRERSEAADGYRPHRGRRDHPYLRAAARRLLAPRALTGEGHLHDPCRRRRTHRTLRGGLR